MSNFQKDLKRGKVGEDTFHKLLPHLEKLGRTADFICPYTDATYEIKTDFTSTDNFFIERWSDVEKKKEGGPWRSKKEGTLYFIYLFPKLGIGYTFKSTALVKAVEKMTGLRKVNVQNRAWVTQGLLVPKKALAKLGKQFTFKVAA